MKAATDQLDHLANLHGINTSYLDMKGQLKSASVESLLAVLKALGTPISGLGDVPAAIREKQQRPLATTVGASYSPLRWRYPDIKSTSTRSPVKDWISASLVMESGEQKKVHWQCDASYIINATLLRELNISPSSCSFLKRLPIGYHKLYLELSGRVSETLIISAPLKAYNPPATKEKIWGVFLPLYALHTRKSWGAGDFADLETLMKWLSQLGGHMIGTLPLLPSFFDESIGPSPYMPASRLFWNEFYLDVFRIPELDKCPSAQVGINSADFNNELAALRKSQLSGLFTSIVSETQNSGRVVRVFFRSETRTFYRF